MKINKHIEGLYSTLELAELLQMNRERIRRNAKKHPELFSYIKNTYYLPQEKLERFKKLLGGENGKPIKKLWKYSEWNDNFFHFIVKKVYLSKTQAMLLKKDSDSKGVLCKISPH